MTNSKTSPQDVRVTRSFQISREHAEALKDIAERNDRTFSAELRRLVAQRIAEECGLEQVPA